MCWHKLKWLEETQLYNEWPNIRRTNFKKFFCIISRYSTVQCYTTLLLIICLLLCDLSTVFMFQANSYHTVLYIKLCLSVPQECVPPENKLSYSFLYIHHPLPSTMPGSSNGEYSLGAFWMNEWMNKRASEWENGVFSLSLTETPLKVGSTLLSNIRVPKELSALRKTNLPIWPIVNSTSSKWLTWLSQ